MRVLPLAMHGLRRFRTHEFVLLRSSVGFSFPSLSVPLPPSLPLPPFWLQLCGLYKWPLGPWGSRTLRPCPPPLYFSIQFHFSVAAAL